jgi:hypothetical protein
LAGRRPLGTEWFKHRSITLEQVLSDPRARIAFEKLCSHGTDRKQLATLVLIAVWFRGFRSDNPLTVHGMTGASLRKLPKDIREMAQRIESICGNPNLYLTPAGNESALSLAKDLHTYADRLETQIHAFRSFLRKHPRHYDMQTVSRRKLLRYVHMATGHPRYTWVADVLSGAPAVGGEEPIVDASSLRKLYMISRGAPRKRS